MSDWAQIAGRTSAPHYKEETVTLLSSNSPNKWVTVYANNMDKRKALEKEERVY